jgi:ATP-dependent helicase/nuclease subunit B
LRELLCAQGSEFAEFGVHVRLWLGPAGSGKTHGCLAEIREKLASAPEGAPLLLIAPKQDTFSLERRLLEEFGLPGFSRLHILSFERLARFICRTLHLPDPEMVDEEGRTMVLRGLLARKREELKLFRASAKLAGFARHLSLALQELQRNQVTPETLRVVADRSADHPALALKLGDLAALLQGYQDWLQEHRLQDAGGLLEQVTRQLNEAPPGIFWETVWVDGFADLSGQEVELLAAVIRRSTEATVTFSDDPARKEVTWLSPWWLTRRSLSRMERRLSSLPEVQIERVPIQRMRGGGRFGRNLVLARLEAQWSQTVPEEASTGEALLPGDTLRIIECDTPEQETVFAAREIRRFVRGGGRYRQVLVLVRSLDSYCYELQRTFARYHIPFFMDRRESVAHHPLAELTRSALRLSAFDWKTDDWFAVLKTGLLPAAEEEIDRLENEALSRGWTGAMWCEPLQVPNDPQLEQWANQLQGRLLPAFKTLADGLSAVKKAPSGPELARLLTLLWEQLGIEETLARWAFGEADANSETKLEQQHTLSQTQQGPPDQQGTNVHGIVWSQMQAWLDNLRLAFPSERFRIREWLPILEAGLGGLSVGLIPPALDQVLVGSVDRSRNPEGRLVLVLGMNDTVFPAPPQGSALFSDTDREQLERQNLLAGVSAREQLSRERHFGYVACTRASERLVLTYALNDPEGAPLNPSPFLAQVQRLFPGLEAEKAPSHLLPEQVEDVCELQPAWVAGLPRLEACFESDPALGRSLLARPYNEPDPNELISKGLTEKLYGKTLRTSVSRLEQFAACPFRFFVHSGLRVQERKLFEADFREQGSFQHDLLALFHQRLTREGKQWRDLTPLEARQCAERLAEELTHTYHDGLLERSAQSRFLARQLTSAVQDFLEVTVGWMRSQYAFQPVAVELAFGEDSDEPGAPAWLVDLDETRQLELRGRIDRVDICAGPEGQAWCVVIDYKSSRKVLDPVLVEHGLQLQLLGYLNVIRRWPEAARHFGVQKLQPAGVFYVNLRGAAKLANSRTEALASMEEKRRLNYRHTGRFDRAILELLDREAQTRRKGDQFNYQINKDGSIGRRSAEPMEGGNFTALLDMLEERMQALGKAIYAGNTAVSPYRKGSQKACDYCEYKAICRLDTWTHRFRVLRKNQDEAGTGEPAADGSVEAIE